MILHKCFQENIENLKNASDKGNKNFVSLKSPNPTSPKVIINNNAIKYLKRYSFFTPYPQRILIQFSFLRTVVLRLLTSFLPLICIRQWNPIALSQSFSSSQARIYMISWFISLTYQFYLECFQTFKILVKEH